MFQNREDGARQLAKQLKGRGLQDPLVLAIPLGGLVTGAVLAHELDADLDVVLARKLRAPGQPEMSLGSVDEAGRVVIAPECAEYAPHLRGYLDQEREYQLAEIARCRRLFRSVRPAAPIAGRSVILTDDGVATGSTMFAALQVLKDQDPNEVIVAVPVTPPDCLAELRRHCDEVICLVAPKSFVAVGQFYADSRSIEDNEAVELLRVNSSQRQAPS